MSPSFVPLGAKQVLTHVGVGMGAASFWRGAWYILDDHLFPEDPQLSAVSSLSLGIVGMAASQGLVQKCEQLQAALVVSCKTQNNHNHTKSWSRIRQRLPLQAARFSALYTIAVSCVLVWRGTWIGWDVVYERTHPDQSPCQTAIKSTDPGHLSTSGVLSHVVAVTALVGTGLFASVLAPPAATGVIRDWTVKAGMKTTNYSSGPAGKLVQLFWHPTKPQAAHVVLQRGFHHLKDKSGGMSTTTTTNHHPETGRRIFSTISSR